MHEKTRIRSWNVPADAGCSDSVGALGEMLADRRGRSICRIIDTIPVSLINDLAVIGSGNALTSTVSSDPRSDEIV